MSEMAVSCRLICVSEAIDSTGVMLFNALNSLRSKSVTPVKRCNPSSVVTCLRSLLPQGWYWVAYCVKARDVSCAALVEGKALPDASRMDARQEANALSGTTLEKLVATDASVLVSSNVVGVEVEAGVRDASLPWVEHAVRESDRTTVIANVQA